MAEKPIAIVEDAEKSAAKSVVHVPAGELVTPSHGRGKLKRGSTKGSHKGGSGRPPNAIRATLRKAFDERIPLLKAFADDETQDNATRLKAIEMLAKYGVGMTQTTTDDEGKAVAPINVNVTLVKPQGQMQALTDLVITRGHRFYVEGMEKRA